MATDGEIGESVNGFTSHDHTVCVDHALALADAHCREQGLRFTEVRRRTLAILLESHCALGAYDVLERLSKEGLGSKPPVAYRALTFLLEQGFIHRIERLNAYIACSHPGQRHEAVFLICSECKAVSETAIGCNGSLFRCARQVGFQIQSTTLEAEGRCPRCRQRDSSR